MSKTAAALSSVPVDPDDATEPAELETARRSRRPRVSMRVPTWLKGNSPAPTFIGVAVAIAGFVLIMIAWGQVAGETQVYLQMPYVISAGLTGLALVMVGL
ncbi:MAG: hypothetical protein JOY57_15715, partial [Actinobacteria bacterium]|nr:hypothetical protein [Actinomycetota bacterium]